MSEQGLSAEETLAGLAERGIAPVDNTIFMQRFDFEQVSGMGDSDPDAGYKALYNPLAKGEAMKDTLGMQLKEAHPTIALASDVSVSVDVELAPQLFDMGGMKV